MKQLLLFLICLFFMACEKEPIEPNNSTAYFMSTKINEQNWSVTNFGDAYFTTGYDYVQKKHTLNIRAVNQDLSSLCNQLGIKSVDVIKKDHSFINGNSYTVINALGASNTDATTGKLTSVGTTGYYALGADIDATATATNGTWNYTYNSPYSFYGFNNACNGWI